MSSQSPPPGLAVPIKELFCLIIMIQKLAVVYTFLQNCFSPRSLRGQEWIHLGVTCCLQSDSVQSCFNYTPWSLMSSEGRWLPVAELNEKKNQYLNIQAGPGTCSESPPPEAALLLLLPAESPSCRALLLWRSANTQHLPGLSAVGSL